MESSGGQAPAPVQTGEAPILHRNPKRLHFTTGIRAGEQATIRDDEGNAVYTYRSFASVIGIVASLVAGIVIITGIAATFFLLVEKHPLTAMIALVLSIFFALLIVMLVPPIGVTLFNGETPAITISQRSRTSFPSATFAVVTPDGETLALLHKTLFSRLGRNRWTIFDAANRQIGVAREDSFLGAIVRKVFGKFSRRYETNVRVDVAGTSAAEIRRREEPDVLQIADDVVDHRVLIALATMVLGSEP